MELDVVAGVMGTGGRPIQMSDSTVMRLMRQFSSGRVPSEVKRRVAARRVFGVGDVAKVVHGPFEDFDFRIVEVGDSSAKGVVNLFGRDNLMELGLENLSTK